MQIFSHRQSICPWVGPSPMGSIWWVQCGSAILYFQQEHYWSNKVLLYWANLFLKFHLWLFIFILDKERLSPVAECSYSQFQYPTYPTMYRSNYWEFHLGIKISQELGIILIIMGLSQNMLLSEEKEKSVAYTLKYLRIGVQVPTQSFIPFDS